MTPLASIYLDALRFFFAFVVLLAHARSDVYTGGIFWRLGPFAQPAVIGFFVLSGFVIAYVTDVRERTFRIYAVNRLARLYSVVLPCLVLTLVVDGIGWRWFESHYLAAPLEIGADHLMLRYIAALFMSSGMGFIGWFTGELHVFFPPGTNGPLWSLSNEVVYYAIFGVAIFGRQGASKALAILVLALVGGPEVIVLMPIWLFGVFAYKMSIRYSIPSWVAVVMVISSWAVFLYVCLDWSSLHWVQPNFISRAIHTDYLIGVVVAANIFAVSSMRASINISGRVVDVVRVLGGLTFPLYVCHRPLLQFLSGFRLGEPGSFVQTSYLLFAIFAIAFALKEIGDVLQRTIRGELLK